MIINQGQSNTLYFTTPSRDTSYFLEMTSLSTNVGATCVPVIVSSNERYLTLRIMETSTPDLSSGSITLSPVGTWKYRLMNSTYDVLREGFATVNGACEPDSVYAYTSDNEGASASVFVSTECLTGYLQEFRVTPGRDTPVDPGFGYAIIVTSLVTKFTYAYFPEVQDINPREIVLNVYVGDEFLAIPGTWTYQIGYCEGDGGGGPNLETFQLVQEGYWTAFPDCEDSTTFAYESTNEDALTSVYQSVECLPDEQKSFFLNNPSALPQPTGDQIYSMRFTSLITREVITMTGVTLNVSNDRILEISVLFGEDVVLSPPGTWKYEIGLYDSVLETFESLLEDYLILAPSCEETTTFSYSSNDDNITSVFVTQECRDECQIWNITEEYWQLDEQLWNCS